MPINPSGILSTPADKLAELVSESSTFQSWVSADDATEALDSVFIQARSASGDGEYSRPFALIYFEGFSNGLNRYANGTLYLLLEADVTESTHQDSAYEFTNQAGAIVAEVMAGSYAGGKLFIRSINSAVPPQRADFNESEDYIQQYYSIDYGLD
ncbi:hypothetical protein [Thalassoroseus pseudoceratinae]|uniref:hypothetical protein n=1 Tax=Thalassoroseus pseudoceratinae TaxID=2713176 RepID=UPI001423A231|nr:hypothetical protein [Thalassoroseus pseudoceratinae]